MRKLVPRLATFAGLLLMLAACADSPTQPELSPVAPVHDDQVQGCVGDGHCVLPGITTPGEPDEPPDCDMWWKPDCGACATTAIGAPEDLQGTFGCPGGGTGPGGGSNPYNPGGGGPSPTAPTEPPLGNDMSRDTIPPDCSAGDLSQWQELYCFRALPPDTAQTRATLQALDAIATRGEACAAIAQKGRELLATGQITFFIWQEGDSGGYGHRNTGIQLNRDSARLYGTSGSTFEHLLVHEIDHVLGFGHLDSQPTETPHTSQCG